MKQLNFLHEIATTMHPDGPHCINGHVYELTADEVKMLEAISRDPKTKGLATHMYIDKVSFQCLELFEKVIVTLSGHLDGLAEVKKEMGENIVRLYPEYSNHLIKVIKHITEEVEFIAKTLKLEKNK